MQQASEVKVGLFVVGVVILSVFIASSLKGGFRGSSRTYEFEIWFDSAPSIGRGSPIRLAGVDVGEVADKDVITVTETTTVQPNAGDDAHPMARVVQWSNEGDSRKRPANVLVSRTLLSAAEAKAVQTGSRVRAVARLLVRVKRQYELFRNFRFEIVGGLVFGDRQLNVSDVGQGGFPMSDEERGASILKEGAGGQRVAVLGHGPASLDAIVGNVQRTLDEDTVARTKQIVKNVQDTTEQAKQLVSALREAVDANRANVDITTRNIARATGDAARIMAEARGHANHIMVNVEKLTAVGRRVAESNEGKLNHIIANVEDTTAVFKRVASNSEARIDRTLEDVAAIAHDVRSMVASNRDNLDNIAAKLSASADDVKAITGTSRQRLDSILAKVDDATTRVRDLLAKTDVKLQAIVDDVKSMTGDARATMGTVREAVGPTTRNLREASEGLNTASRNIAALTADPSTKQILANVERATAEARELLADLRTLTSDPKLREDIRATTAHVRSVSEKMDRTLGGLTSFRPSYTADAYYGFGRNLWHSDVNIGVHLGRTTSAHFGMSDVTHRPTTNAQLGRDMLGGDLLVRYGFYRGRLGLGADWRLDPRTRIRADVYGFEHTRLSLKLTYRTPWGLKGLFGVDDATSRPDWLLGVQLGRSWK